MTLYTARHLCHVDRRYDWDGPRLAYLPARLYERIVNRRLR